LKGFHGGMNVDVKLTQIAEAINAGLWKNGILAKTFYA